MDINWNTNEDPATYTERINKEVEEKAKELGMTVAQIHEIAISAHKIICSASHEDSCGWYYIKDADKFPWTAPFKGKFDPRIEWLAKAIKVLEAYKAHDGFEQIKQIFIVLKYPQAI